MARLSPIAPSTPFRRPTVAGEWDGASLTSSLTISRALQGTARSKFEKGFLASLSGSAEAENIRETGTRVSVPQRCSSVLGLRSHERKSEWTSNDKMVLDYIDLECLLQDKMREFNVQMPKFKNGRYHGRRERPFERTNNASGDNEFMPQDQEPSHAPCPPSPPPAPIKVATADDYVKRIREAAFLFRLCQQEMKIQFSIHCPERARLVDKTLEFFSTVLDYLISPLEQSKTDLDALTREREDDAAWQGEVLSRIKEWMKDNLSSLDSDGWKRAGGDDHAATVAAAAAASGEGEEDAKHAFRNNVELLWHLFRRAMHCLSLLQSDKEGLERDRQELINKRVPKEHLLAATDARAAAEADARAARAEHAAAVAQLQQQLQQAREQVLKVEGDVAAARQGWERAEGKCVCLTSDLESARAGMQQAHDRAEQVKALLEQCEAKRQALEAALGEREEAAAALQARIDALQRDTCHLTPRPHLPARAAAAATAAGDLLEVDVDLDATRAPALTLTTPRESTAGRVERLEAELAAAEGELRRLKYRSTAEVGCEAPQRGPPGVVMVDVSEYLTSYLSKRFGIQGHISAWEVEKMAKDFGWVMQAQVILKGNTD